MQTNEQFQTMTKTPLKIHESKELHKLGAQYLFTLI